VYHPADRTDVVSDASTVGRRRLTVSNVSVFRPTVWCQCLKLRDHEPLSSFALDINLRRYTTALRFSEQGEDAKQHMHAFFFYADCYHEVDEAGPGWHA
jgi:hypothetical protein